MAVKITYPFGIGWVKAKQRWDFLIRCDLEGVKQCIHLAIAQVPPDDIRALDNAVKRELHKLARELGWRYRSYRSGKNELGQRWERTIVPEGLVPKNSAERRSYEKMLRQKGSNV